MTCGCVFLCVKESGSEEKEQSDRVIKMARKPNETCQICTVMFSHTPRHIAPFVMVLNQCYATNMHVSTKDELPVKHVTRG